MLSKSLDINLTLGQRILFDPLSWIDSGWVKVPVCFSQGRCRGVINEAILTSLDLSTPSDICSPSELTQLFANQWYLLRKSAFLIACQRYRANLACRGRLQCLPDNIKQFAQLEILTSKYQQGEKLLTIDKIPDLALRELLPFCQALPRWLQQRVPLLFPPVLDSSTGDLPGADTALLRLAIQHAKRTP
ncbi:hypothetical protein [Serratia liquefaciens]|uniref:hypothetical protein n=1 Tax=Serratia liquefaciens TaxID=614 RepID=UPI0021578412|nr:hypothetical protein [Serratia liquefaciens]